MIALAAAIAAPAAHAAPAAVAARAAQPASTPLVVLLRAHVARATPDAHARSRGRLPARTPITRARTILPVLERRDGWVLVALPGRPNGRRGWIAASSTLRSSTPWRLVIRLGTRRVTAYRAGHAVRAFSAVVGAPATPTPRGTFFVEESIALGAGDVGGPFALALSARSTVLQEFAGGPGQIAVHGRDNLGGTLGQALSHGCVRLSDRAIRWLARRIGPGVPVVVDR
jgi:lipoprotein-anchoring transpeptidase ErfK/SrfK